MTQKNPSGPHEPKFQPVGKYYIPQRQHGVPSFLTRHTERPTLNLTRQKQSRGMIAAKNMLAKGPDGTRGFLKGWTRRKSLYI
jgi:hypothetical protein